jgi:MFS family permease
LNTFFAAASTTCNISALPVGTILDRYGPRVTAIIGSISLAIGTVLMACAFAIPEFDGYLLGNTFLALGGTFIFVPSFQIANAFPKSSGTIVATVTGAFDASAAVFLLYRLVYEASGGAFTPQIFFLAYLVVPALILVLQLTLMNENMYKTVSQLEMKLEKELDATQDVHDSDEDLSDGEVKDLRQQRQSRRESKLEELDKLLGNAEERQKRAGLEEDRLASSGIWGVLHGKSAMEQILTPWFILITLLTVLQMLRMNFFIATIRAQYEAMLESEILAKQINDFFDIALPVGGVVATPFIGALLDTVSTATMLAILVSMITAVGIFGSLPFLWAGYVNVVIFVLLRPLYYSAMSDYAVKVFGFATFGRVYGCVIALSGLINLSQPLIDAMNHTVFDDNPIPINVFLASLGSVFGAALVVYVWWQSTRIYEEVANRESEWDRFRRIPEEDEITDLEI